MPTILRDGPYRVYFYSHDLSEPPHLHMDRDDRSAKFWLDPISLASNLGFKPKELYPTRSVLTLTRSVSEASQPISSLTLRVSISPRCNVSVWAARSIRVIAKMLVENQGALLNGWREHMGSVQ